MLDPISIRGLSLAQDLKLPALDDTAPAASGSQSFGGMLGTAIENLDTSLTQASTQATALATGQATDVTKVVSDVERASLELQMATQFRNKAVDAYQEILRMQI